MCGVYVLCRTVLTIVWLYLLKIISSLKVFKSHINSWNFFIQDLFIIYCVLYEWFLGEIISENVSESDL